MGVEIGSRLQGDSGAEGGRGGHDLRCRCMVRCLPLAGASGGPLFLFGSYSPPSALWPSPGQVGTESYAALRLSVIAGTCSRTGAPMLTPRTEQGAGSGIGVSFPCTSPGPLAPSCASLPLQMPLAPPPQSSPPAPAPGAHGRNFLRQPVPAAERRG